MFIGAICKGTWRSAAVAGNDKWSQGGVGCLAHTGKDSCWRNLCTFVNCPSVEGSQTVLRRLTAAPWHALLVVLPLLCDTFCCLGEIPQGSHTGTQKALQNPERWWYPFAQGHAAAAVQAHPEEQKSLHGFGKEDKEGATGFLNWMLCSQS